MVEHQQNSKSSAPMIVTGLIMILLFCGFAFFLVSQGQSIPNVEQLREETRLKNLADLNAENQKVLTQYHWVDKSKGIVGIPIDQAMDLVLVQLQSIKPHPAGPVSTPPPPPPPPAQQPQGTPAAPQPKGAQAAPQPKGTPAPSPGAQGQKQGGQQ
jgi:outer membrane biosynthesis protein TonB